MNIRSLVRKEPKQQEPIDSGSDSDAGSVRVHPDFKGFLFNLV